MIKIQLMKDESTTIPIGRNWINFELKPGITS